MVGLLPQKGILKLFRAYIYLFTCFILGMLYSGNVAAQEKFLPSEQAFEFQAQSITNRQVELKWQVADHYYLYKHQFAVQQGQQSLTLDLPPAKNKYDEYYGNTQVYYHQIAFSIAVEPNQQYQVSFQGCAEQGLCYPLSKTEFRTDQDGLLVLSDQAVVAHSQNDLFKPTTRSAFELTTSSSAIAQASSDQQSTSIALQENAEDQQWLMRLQQQSLLWSVVLFLGLGCLLAFTPCSLPMLPILSSLLIRKHSGVRAVAISLVFVLSMASVYAILGIVAASAGSSFQRWLQQPAVLIVFSGIFVVLALNLFGVFELKLPQAWSNKLDQLQAHQKGGTLLSAGLMGALSALLVGPCMTAPLAGTLLYISQTQNIWIGAALLFSLGLGMGLPLLLLSLIGEKALPKPGAWMHDIRHIFAFIMLGLSLYFVRPLLPIAIFNICLLLISLALLGYLIYLTIKKQNFIRYIAMVLLVLLTSLSVWKGVQYWQYQHTQPLVWQVVSTKSDFDRALAEAKQAGRPIIVDVYADWCIACQPIERKVWTSPEVQQALQDKTKIKIDLSRYDASQQILLNEWQMLGPPTVLFLDEYGQEQRLLRLTGEFKKLELLENLYVQSE